MVSAAVIVLALSLQVVTSQVSASSSTRELADDTTHSSTLEDAQRFFYNGDYTRAAMLTQVLCAARADDLDACELRTASLLFQIKKALEETGERDKTTAWNLCTVCPALLSAFMADTARGQAFARARLKTHPDHEDTLFFLGKVDLNYVWLQLGMLGRKTGWDEYWEARRSLDRVLRLNPEHVRARVARAWVDYIVGTRSSLAARRREQEAWTSCRRRGRRNGPRQLLRSDRSHVRALGYAGARTRSPRSRCHRTATRPRVP
jgi:hypothetical protein